MSCGIEIEFVWGIRTPGSQTPHTIHVEGYVEGIVGSTGKPCQKVIVETNCYKPGDVTVDVDQETLDWEANIHYPGGETLCDCIDTIINVTAQCEEDPSCGDNWVELLICREEPDCPDVYGITASTLECQNGKRKVTLEADVWPVGDDCEDVREYKWEFGDPADSEKSISPDNPGDEPWPSTKTTFNFPAPGQDTTISEYEVTFTVVGTEVGCSNTRTETITVRGCGGPCPTIKNVDVIAGDCSSDDKRRTMLIEAEIEGGGVTEYEWDYGIDGLPPVSTSMPSTSHKYDAPGDYTGKLTIRGPAGCPESEMSFNVNVQKCGEDKPTRRKKKCPWWNPKCWFRGLKDFFEELKCGLLGIGIALLVGGYIVGVAYCGGQDWTALLEALTLLSAAATGGVVIGTLAIIIALLKYQDACGPCRLGTWMLIGVFMAIIALIILWIIGYTPSCIIPAALVAVGFFIAALDRLNECDKEDCQHS